jgi:hypothetical protein
VVSVTPRPRFTPGERTTGTHCTGGWVGPRADLDTEARGKILCLCRGSNPGRPVCNQTLFRVISATNLFTAITWSVNFPFVLHRCETRFLSLREERKLMVPGNKLRISESETWFCCSSRGWWETMSLDCGHLRAYFSSPSWYEYGELRWNDTDMGKSTNSKKNLSQCHFVHHKSHIDRPGREPGPALWEAGD